MFIVFYLLRSGNYLLFQFPVLDGALRLSLEDLLVVRPRTKEFLIGYPFLMMAYYFVDRGFSRKWLWVLNLLGSVSLISMLNTFAHIHSPIMLSLYRSFLGIILGVIVMFVYVLGYRIFRLLFSRRFS